MVEFHIRKSELDPFYYPRKYFIRAPHPADAITTVGHMWLKWARKDRGIPNTTDPGYDLDLHKFPMIAGYSVATRLDEDDYFRAWKEAQKWPRLYFAPHDTRNPIVFTFTTDETEKAEYFGDDYCPPTERIEL